MLYRVPSSTLEYSPLVYKLDVQVLAYVPSLNVLGSFKSLFPRPLLDLRSTCVCPNLRNVPLHPGFATR